MNAAAPRPGLGLYSIGVRGLSLPGLLGWAALHDIPFLHLRGGRRGFDVAAVPDAVLDLWRDHIEATIPVTMVTAEHALDDLLSLDRETARGARSKLARTADAARRIGAGSVRVLASVPPTLTVVNQTSPIDLGLPLLIELHDPAWWGPAGLEVLSVVVATWPRVRLLADSAQVAAAVTGRGRAAVEEATPWVLAHASVVHLSDDGTGFHGPGHRLLAEHAHAALRSGRRLEIALEWTGPDRQPTTCLERYRQASIWWSATAEAEAAP